MKKIKISRPAWVEVHIDRLRNNIEEIKGFVGDREVLGVVKANAYGHGVEAVTKELLEAGIKKFAIATVSEAMQLRRMYPTIEILIFGAIQEEFSEEILEGDFIATVSRVEEIEFLKKKAIEKGKCAKINLKVDTGMHRLGFDPTRENAIEIAKTVKSGVDIVGAYTHFAISYEDDVFTLQQSKIYDEFMYFLKEEGIEIGIQHVCNSAAIIRDSELYHDMVRAGIILYGVYPIHGPEYKKMNLQQPMEIKCKVVMTRAIEAGETVGYGRTFTAKDRREIATLPIGYADGFPRRLSNRFEVLVKGKKAKITGFVCMDQMMIDITGMDVEINDIVTLIGKDGEEKISVEDFADAYETSPYEILCLWSPRLPRVYYRNGEIIDVHDDLLN